MLKMTIEAVMLFLFTFLALIAFDFALKQITFRAKFSHEFLLSDQINKQSENHDTVSTLKKSLLNNFDSNVNDDIYICPESLTPLKKTKRVYGFVQEKYYTSNQFGTKYMINPIFADFTIKSDTEKPFWESSKRERIGQKLFQNPFVSWIYERGYRQNFQTIGFPGIELEFAEAREFFESANATDTIIDLSCGSGFMMRNFIKSKW